MGFFALLVRSVDGWSGLKLGLSDFEIALLEGLGAESGGCQIVNIWLWILLYSLPLLF